MPVAADYVVLACPACSKRMAVDASPADGAEFTCPHCDAEFAARLRTPNRGTPPPSTSAGQAPSVGKDIPPNAPSIATTATASPAIPHDQKAPETEVLFLRASLFRTRPGLYAALLLGVATGSVVSLLALIQGHTPYLWLPGAVLASGCAAALGVWRLRTMHSWVRITNKRIIDSDGFFHKTVSEVLHRDIRTVRVQQTLVERLTNAGTLSIYTASDDQPEVHMSHVPKPHRVREVLDTYRSL